MNERTQQAYLSILQEELILATGCTEPIAIAYCAATLRELLGALPEQVDAAVSGNILKNVKSVVVPNTGGRKGIAPAIAVGLVAGDAARDLQVISAVTEEQLAELDAYLQRVDISVSCSHSPCQLDIDLRGSCGGHTARVRITNHHTNIVCLERDGEVLRELPVVDSAEEHRADKSLLNVADILRFAAEVPLEDLLPLLEPQVSCNSAIAEEGLRGAWGAQIGRILLEDYGDDIKQRAKAYAAAGSDARMSGCEMPVVILSGSGNQGITACMPVVAYATSARPASSSTARWPFPTLSPSTRRPASAASPPTAGPSPPGSARARGSATCSAATMTPLRTRSSTLWLSSPAPSATAQSRPARPRSPLPWMRASWATACICTTANSATARASSAAMLTIRSPRSACWRSRACGRRTARSSISCRIAAAERPRSFKNRFPVRHNLDISGGYTTSTARS